MIVAHRSWLLAERDKGAGTRLIVPAGRLVVAIEDILDLPLDRPRVGHLISEMRFADLEQGTPVGFAVGVPVGNIAMCASTSAATRCVRSTNYPSRRKCQVSLRYMALSAMPVKVRMASSVRR